MQRPRLFLGLIAISFASAWITAQAQQVAPQKYLIKPLNLNINTEIRARSTRHLQVRITDENDRPVPDAPVIFSLSGGAAASGNVGSFAGQTSLRVVTDAEGIAQAEFTAGEAVGKQAQIKAQVEGSEAIWETTLLIISALAGGSAPPSPTLPTAQPPAPTRPADSSSAPAAAPLPLSSFSKLVIGQLPSSSVTQRTFTTTDGKKISLDSRRHKVVVLFFFGAWCDASQKLVIALKKLREKDQSEELEIIGLSVKDPRSTPLVFQRFMEEQKVNYPVVQDVEDKHFMRFVNSQEVSVPQTLIYRQGGQLIGHYLGFNQQVGNEIERIINQALVRK